MSLGFKTKLLWFQNILKTVIWLKLGQDLKSFGRLKIGTLVTLKLCVKKFGSDPFFIEHHKLEFWHKPQIGVLYNWAYNFYAEFWAPLQTEWIWLNQSFNLVASSCTVFYRKICGVKMDFKVRATDFWQFRVSNCHAHLEYFQCWKLGRTTFCTKMSEVWCKKSLLKDYLIWTVRNLGFWNILENRQLWSLELRLNKL